MFTFAENPVTWVGLFVLLVGSTLWLCYELVRPLGRRERATHTALLVLSVTLTLMVSQATWPALIRIVPVWTLVGLFLALAVRFVYVLVDIRRSGGRNASVYAAHAALFLAMCWHLSCLAVRRGLAAESSDALADASAPGGTLWVLALVGLPFMVFLFGYSIGCLLHLVFAPAPTAGASGVPGASGASGECGPECPCQADASVGVRHARQGGVAVKALPLCPSLHPVGSTRYRLRELCDFALTFSLFWASAPIMVPVLPWFGALTF
ncbi:MAG: hypothetical protein Q4F65_08415 [Propionibacteriaceae bacterium]|nr:hypothetical protein [Propionibacteriaceae bacterium]